jgi:hypothetical protein
MAHIIQYSFRVPERLIACIYATRISDACYATQDVSASMHLAEDVAQRKIGITQAREEALFKRKV